MACVRACVRAYVRTCARTVLTNTVCAEDPLRVEAHVWCGSRLSCGELGFLWRGSLAFHGMGR